MQTAPDFKKQAVGTIASVSAKADSLRGGVNRAAHEVRPTLTELAQKVKKNPEFGRRVRQMAQRHAELMNDISTANSTPVALATAQTKPAARPEAHKTVTGAVRGNGARAAATPQQPTVTAAAPANTPPKGKPAIPRRKPVGPAPH